jgi:hypothetical protein
MMEKFVLGGDRSLAYAYQMEALTVGPLRGDRRLEDLQGRWPEDYLGDHTRSVPQIVRQEEQALRFKWVI